MINITTDELMTLLPSRITLSESENYFFNSFTLIIKKSFIIKEAIIIESNSNLKKSEVYIINYECDSTSLSGEDAWLRRLLFNKNIVHENFREALLMTLDKIKELEPK